MSCPDFGKYRRMRFPGTRYGRCRAVVVVCWGVWRLTSTVVCFLALFAATLQIRPILVTCYLGAQGGINNDQS